ncbi:unnamed protein product [Sphagnum balticum]
MIKNTGRGHRQIPSGDSSDTQRRLTKHEQIAMITTLEKCTRTLSNYAELHRDDKAVIRRKLRELDEEVVALFSKHKKPISTKLLSTQTTKFCRSSSEGLSEELSSYHSPITRAVTKKTYRVRPR